ncbi:hypothetical protein QJS10_CPA10g00992 [Acorus calamus]|uniref:U3 small nucleolar RNA-associated protein 18 homolog n=1 Tax=Acorus calamus TaxID=4465 RepID=A0AAV9DYI2_ACOCL|nr:hypothetical protein QJS10_CPA10g00992 [Acorus calamus]
MSLISQNVLLNKPTEEIRQKEEEEEGREEENGEKSTGETETAALKRRKRKRGKSSKFEEAKREEDMKNLQNDLFGSIYSPLEFGNESHQAPLFFIDRSADDETAVFEEDAKSELEEEETRKPVWVDDEEETAEVDILNGANRLRKLRREEDEKVISAADYVSRLRAQHDELLRSNGEAVVRGGKRLLPGLLEYSKLVDANSEEPSRGPVNSVQFHRNAQLLLTAGRDGRMRFFQIDGKRNPKIQSVFIEDCPVRKASFLPDGSQVIMGGRRKYFYSLDLVKGAIDKVGPLMGREEKSLESFEVSPDSKTIAFIGNEGYILLVCPRYKKLIGTVKMNGTARSLAFADDGRLLMSSGGDGHVYTWDLRKRECLHKGIDEGCLTGSALCTSVDSTLFAAGSSTGIVNVYNREEFIGGKRKPAKTIENLTTKIDYMKFNHDNQILAIGSTMQKNSLKLVHLPSYNVFSNWPAPRLTLGRPQCMDFSPNSGFMAVGNSEGKVKHKYLVCGRFGLRRLAQVDHNVKALAGCSGKRFHIQAEWAKEASDRHDRQERVLIQKNVCNDMKATNSKCWKDLNPPVNGEDSLYILDFFCFMNLLYEVGEIHKTEEINIKK